MSAGCWIACRSVTTLSRTVGANSAPAPVREEEDKSSVLAEPMYVDPQNGDFRVKEGSLALKLGFKDFPMDQFGVKKPSLRAIAKTPEIPALDESESFGSTT